LKDLQLLIKLKNLKIWNYIWEDFSVLYNQIQRKGKFIESRESSTTSNEMVNSIDYRSILLYSKDWWGLSIIYPNLKHLETSLENLKVVFCVLWTMDKHKNKGNYFQLHPHRHTGSCRTDETETSGDLSCLLHYEVGNAKYLSCENQ
jgi:hypothetical protein